MPTSGKPDNPYVCLSWDKAKSASKTGGGLMPQDFNGPGFAATKPTRHLPGSPGKIAVMAERYAQRQPLFHAGDAT